MSFDLILPFLQPVAEPLLDPAISEIMVNPDGTVWVEKAGQMALLPDARFDAGALLIGLEVIANRFQRKLYASSPILNLRLPDGSRLAAMIPPLVNPNPLLTIRKFTSRDFSIEDLIERRMLTEEQAMELTAAVTRGDNILIAGSTGSGKTTLLNVLADFIPDDERILLIEDTAELHIRKRHVIQTAAQAARLLKNNSAQLQNQRAAAVLADEEAALPHDALRPQRTDNHAAMRGRRGTRQKADANPLLNQNQGFGRREGIGGNTQFNSDRAHVLLYLPVQSGDCLPGHRHERLLVQILGTNDRAAG